MITKLLDTKTLTKPTLGDINEQKSAASQTDEKYTEFGSS